VREAPPLQLGIALSALFFLAGGFLAGALFPIAVGGGQYLLSSVYRTLLTLIFNISVAVLGLVWLTNGGLSTLRDWARTDRFLRDMLCGITAGVLLFAAFGILAVISQKGVPGLWGAWIHFKHPEFHIFLGRIIKHLLSPIGEEFFFRGLLFSVMASRYGLAKGALASSLIFSAAHFDSLPIAPEDLSRAAWFAFSGLVYCELFRRRGNLYAAIFAHSAYNLLTSLFYLG